MKKLTLIPKTDTITICLPAEWVGKIVTCTLHNTEKKTRIALPLAAERKIPYNASKKSGRKKRKPNAN